MSNVRSITINDLRCRIDQGDVDLLDVRTPTEFREVHASVACNQPLDALDPRLFMQTRNVSTARPLYVICKSGARGAKAQQRFVECGFENVINVEGGTEAWVAAGLPVVRGKQAVSLERQVRIFAGFVVLVSAVLSMTVESYYAAIAAIMGGGLMFAGITNSCALGMLMAKMPWNR